MWLLVLCSRFCTISRTTNLLNNTLCIWRHDCSFSSLRMKKNNINWIFGIIRGRLETKQYWCYKRVNWWERQFCMIKIRWPYCIYCQATEVSPEKLDTSIIFLSWKKGALMTKLKQIECCNFKEHRSFFTSEEGFNSVSRYSPIIDLLRKPMFDGLCNHKKF